MNKPELPLASTDKDAPLRDDIRRLGRLLGDTIRGQEGEPTFELIEKIRQLAVTYRRDSDQTRKQELESVLNRLSHEDTIAVVRSSPISPRICITIAAAARTRRPARPRRKEAWRSPWSEPTQRGCAALTCSHSFNAP